MVRRRPAVLNISYLEIHDAWLNESSSSMNLEGVGISGKGSPKVKIADI